MKEFFFKKNFDLSILENREISQEIEINIEGATKPSAEHSDHHNEDRMLIIEGRVAAVFDGDGGHDNGEKASKIARNLICGKFMEIPNDPLDPLPSVLAVRQAIKETNKAIFQEAQLEKSNMGTTASVLYIWKGKKESKIIIGNVGDSRVYLLREQKLEQITIDDNKIREKERNERKARELQSKLSNVTDKSYKQLSDDERELFDARNLISQSLGQSSIVVDLQIVNFLPSDKTLICSDGITDNLTDIEIQKIMNKYKDNKKTVDMLIKKAKKKSRQKSIRSRKDDMTAIIVEYCA